MTCRKHLFRDVPFQYVALEDAIYHFTVHSSFAFQAIHTKISDIIQPPNGRL